MSMSTDLAAQNKPSSAAAPGGGHTDVTSLINQVTSLQEDRDRMIQQIENYKSTVGKLQQGKREEMKQIFDNVISKWLADSVADETVRTQFQDGVKRMVDNTNECGVWTVACEASKLHVKQLEELEKLRSEVDTLRSSGGSSSGGAFKDENSRKRTLDKTNEPPSATNDFWGGITTVDYI